MSSKKNGRPLSALGQEIRRMRVGDELVIDGKREWHIRGVVYYAQRSLGIRLVCNHTGYGRYKVARLRKARAA